jgi:predicted DsbA family dithiol-disulfide isomerase
MAIAQSVGLDVDRLKQDMSAPSLDAKIAGTVDLAHNKLGITGTPGLLIADQLFGGPMPYDAMRQVVARAREDAAAGRVAR